MERIECRIVTETISPREVHSFLSCASHGAQSTFFGVVREENYGKKVVKLSYDAYTPLAEKMLAQICTEAASEWGSELKIIALHRIGDLLVGDISVAIGVSAPHRDEACKACRFIIDELKHRAPIWKKEFYESGESEWQQGCHLTPS